MKLRSFITGIVSLTMLCTLSVAHADEKLKFEKSYDAAVKKAKAEKKPLIVVFSASWCGPCVQMKKDVYPSKEVSAYHDQFVWAYLDIDEASNEKPAKKHGVSSIPHIVFLNGEGKELDKQVGGSEPSEFAETLKGILEKAKK
jgi:thioredoxin-related protein